MNTPEIHELCAMWPTMAADQLKELADDIKVNGVCQKIILYQDKVLDGRNRLLAMQLAGIEPQTEHFKLYEGTDPAGLVISLNARRRHMPKADRALVVAELRKLQGSTSPIEAKNRLTIAQAAKAAKVSQGTMKAAVAVAEKAIPAVRAAVKSKAVTLEEGAAVARRSRSVQNKAAKEGPAGIKAAAAATAKPPAAAPQQAKAAPWTMAMRDEAVRRLQSCYEANKAKWNSPPPPSPRIMVDAMIWAMNEGMTK